MLLTKYPRSEIRGDDPTVVVDFERYKIEIAPGFIVPGSTTYIYDQNFKVWLCDTNDGGRYKLAAPVADRFKAHASNTATSGDFANLMQMLKIWKWYCSVPIKSFALEQIAIDFLAQWSNAGKGYHWYDWMLRDFFAYLLTRRNDFAVLPATSEVIFFGDEWSSRAETAFGRAQRACGFEEFNLNASAGEEWQKIFG